MVFQPVVDTAEVTLVFTQNGETITNTFAIEKGGGYNQSDITNIANQIDNSVPTHLIGLMTIDAIYQQTEVRGLAVPNDLFAVDGTNGQAGGDASTGLPNNVTLSIKKLSAFTGRSARGRWYFIGLPLDNLDPNENKVLQADADLIVQGLDAFRNAASAGVWQAVIVSRFADSLPRSTGKTFDWINTVAVDRNTDSQRGRLTR